MSKRIDYNNDKNIAPADSAVIVPEAAPNAAPAAAKSSKMTSGSKTLAIILIVIAVCSIALLTISLIVNGYVNKISAGHYEKVEINVAPEIGDMGIYNEPYISNEAYIIEKGNILTNFAEASHSIKDADHIHNFAIYGVNKFADAENGLATFIIVASFNTETQKVTYITFVESMLVYIPMVGVGRIRDAYEFGGAALLTKTIKYNFGFQIDGYIEADMTVTSNFIDELGGITVSKTTTTDVISAIDSYNEKFGTAVEYPNVSNGSAHLNGMQSIAFLRANNENLTQVVQNLGTLIFANGVGGMADAFDFIYNGTKISMERDDLLALAKMSLTMLKNAEATTIYVGEETKYSLYYKGYYAYVINGELERQNLIEAIYGEKESK